MTTAKDNQPDPEEVLSHYDIDVVTSVAAAGGTAGRTWKIHTESATYFLRLRGVRTSTQERLEYDHGLRRRLAARRVPTAQAIPTQDGRQWLWLGRRVYELYPFVEGSLFDFGSRDELRSAARALAQFHDAAKDYTPPNPRPFEIAQYAWLGFCDGTSDRMDEPDLQAANIEAILAISQTDEDKAAAAWALERARCLRETNAGEQYERLRNWVGHGDYTPANLLFAPDHSVAGIFDFDWAMPCPRVRDIGDALFFFAGLRPTLDTSDIWSLTVAVPFDFERCVTFVQAYLEVSRLSADEWAAIPAAFEGRWLSIRLEGMAKVPGPERIRFFNRGDIRVPIDWLDANWQAVRRAAAAV